MLGKELYPGLMLMFPWDNLLFTLGCSRWFSFLSNYFDIAFRINCIGELVSGGYLALEYVFGVHTTYRHDICTTSAVHLDRVSLRFTNYRLMVQLLLESDTLHNFNRGEIGER